MDADAFSRLVDLLEQVKAFQDQNARRRLLGGITGSEAFVRNADDPRADLALIVRQAQSLGELEALRGNILELVPPDSELRKQIEEALAELAGSARQEPSEVLWAGEGSLLWDDAEKHLVVYAVEGGAVVRSQASPTGEVVSQVAERAKLVVLEPLEEAFTKATAGKGWLRVRDEAGKEGYVAARAVTMDPPQEELVQAMLRQAAEQAGAEKPVSLAVGDQLAVEVSGTPGGGEAVGERPAPPRQEATASQTPAQAEKPPLPPLNKIFRKSITVDRQWQAGGGSVVPVILQNQGEGDWTAEMEAELRVQWMRPGLTFDRPYRQALGRQVGRGEEVALGFTVQAPDEPGDYQTQWSVRPFGWEAVVEEPGGPHLANVEVAPGEPPEQVKLPKVVVQSVLPKDEKVVNNRGARFTLALFNQAGEGERTWQRGERWRVWAEWRPAGKGKLVRREIERKFPARVAPGMGYDLGVTVQAPNPTGEFAVSFGVEPLEWQAVVETRAKVVRVNVEPYEGPEQFAGFDLIDFISAEPPEQVIKARKYGVKVRIFNKGRREVASTHQLRLYLTLKRQGDDFTLGDMAALPLGVDLAAGRDHELTFYFQAPRYEGRFAAEWELRPEESWKAQVINPVKNSILSLLPTPARAKKVVEKEQPKLPPRGGKELSLEEGAAAPRRWVYETFYRPLVTQAAQEGDIHRLDIHLVPRRHEEGSAAEGWKYQVVVTQYEGNPSNPQAGYYESPFELDEKVAPLEELGTPRAGKLLFDGLFSQKQIAAEAGGGQNPCTLFGLQRALALALKKEGDCLRLQVRLNNQTPVVHSYRWEYLWDAGGVEGGPLATSEKLPFARVLHLSSLTQYVPEALSDTEPLRLLVAVASPAVLGKEAAGGELAGLGPITEAEVQALKESLDLVGRRLKYEILWDASLEGLGAKLKDGLEGKPFQALHLLCHGVIRSVGGQACLVLQRGKTKEAHLVSDQAFADQLQSIQPSLRLVVLASCLTALPTNHLPLQGVARSLLAKTEIPAVVAMQDRLQIEAAQFFAQRFYRRLVDTGEVDRAVNAGRRELFDRKIKDPDHPLKEEVLPNQWGVPVLFMRVLNGKLFEVAAPSGEAFKPQAKSLGELSNEDLRRVSEAMLHQAASQVGLQLNLGLPNLAQSFVEALELARRGKAPEPKPEARRIFGEPRQQAERWWLVWAAGLYRKHPARRTVLFARRARLREIRRLLERESLPGAGASFAGEVQRAGQATWYEESVDGLSNRVEIIRHVVRQISGSGPENTPRGAEADALSQERATWLEDELTHQPLEIGGHLARPADWRMAYRGFESYSGEETDLRLRLEGNLTWEVANPLAFEAGAYEQLLYGENPLQAFEELRAEGKLDEESAALALGAVYPDRYLPFREAQRKEAFRRLGLEGGTLYSPDYAGYCALGRDLLADGDLGFEDLVDVHFFLQRLAHGDYLTSADLEKESSGKLRPKDLRIQLRPVELDPERVDSDLVIRESVLLQAAAALNAGKHIILIGPPGTGKTTLAEDLCRFAHDWDFNRGHVLVTATADWTTFDTIGGYMPEEGDRLVFKPGIFLEAIEAEKWLVIDEINRADIDKAFGELFTVLSGQAVTLPYQAGERLVRILPAGQTPSQETQDYPIPQSWRIIGTMNIYDKASLFAMSYAFMRRFAFINVPVPEEKPYERLLRHFIDHHRLKAQAGGRRQADEDLQKLITTPEAENPLMGQRAIGPAISLDVLSYLGSRTRREGGVFNHSHLAEALSLYVLPQLDGLEQDAILAVFDQLRETFQGYEGEAAVGAMFERIKELFPFVPRKKWEEARQR